MSSRGDSGDSTKADASGMMCQDSQEEDLECDGIDVVEEVACGRVAWERPVQMDPGSSGSSRRLKNSI